MEPRRKVNNNQRSLIQSNDVYFGGDMRRHATAATLVSLVAPVLLGGCQNGVAKETKQPTDPPAIVQEYDSTGAKTPTEQAIDKILDEEQIPEDETSTKNSSKGKTSETSAEPTDDIEEITTEESSSTEAIEKTEEDSSAEATKPANDKIETAETAETAETPAEFGLRLLEYGDDLTNDIIEEELQKYLEANGLDDVDIVRLKEFVKYDPVVDFVPYWNKMKDDYTTPGKIALNDYGPFNDSEFYRAEYITQLAAAVEKAKFYNSTGKGSLPDFFKDNDIPQEKASKCLRNLGKNKKSWNEYRRAVDIAGKNGAYYYYKEYLEGDLAKSITIPYEDYKQAFEFNHDYSGNGPHVEISVYGDKDLDEIMKDEFDYATRGNALEYLIESGIIEALKPLSTTEALKFLKCRYENFRERSETEEKVKFGTNDKLTTADCDAMVFDYCIEFLEDLLEYPEILDELYSTFQANNNC